VYLDVAASLLGTATESTFLTISRGGGGNPRRNHYETPSSTQ